MKTWFASRIFCKEINTQIEPMREQAENTRRYRSLFERQRLLDANIFLINLERSENKIAKLEEELSIIDRELSEGADEADIQEKAGKAFRAD